MAVSQRKSIWCNELLEKDGLFFLCLHSSMGKNLYCDNLNKRGIILVD